MGSLQYSNAGVFGGCASARISVNLPLLLKSNTAAIAFAQNNTPSSQATWAHEIAHMNPQGIRMLSLKHYIRTTVTLAYRSGD